MGLEGGMIGFGNKKNEYHPWGGQGMMVAGDMEAAVYLNTIDLTFVFKRYKDCMKEVEEKGGDGDLYTWLCRDIADTIGRSWMYHHYSNLTCFVGPYASPGTITLEEILKMLHSVKTVKDMEDALSYLLYWGHGRIGPNSNALRRCFFIFEEEQKGQKGEEKT